MRLHRVVVLGWRRVGLVNGHLGSGHAGVDVAGERVGREVRVDVIRGEQLRMVG